MMFAKPKISVFSRLRFAALCSAVVLLALSATPLLPSVVDAIPMRQGGPRQEITLIKANLERLIAAKYRRAGASHVSVYFRELGAEPDLAIDRDFYFSPASLMKVPIMMAYLKQAESNPNLLSRRLTFSGRNDYTVSQGIKPQENLTPGTTYTVEELLRRMIAYSDNNALMLLYNNIDLRHVYALMESLGVEYFPSVDGGRISLTSYAKFYRSLHEASYLNRTMSDHALAYLEQEAFSDGLAGGVPRGTRIAAKFGEWAGGRHSEIRHVSEMGIIYYPGRPYLLGVAIEGQDIRQLSTIIRDISREVYQEVDQFNQHNHS